MMLSMLSYHSALLVQKWMRVQIYADLLETAAATICETRPFKLLCFSNLASRGQLGVLKATYKVNRKCCGLLGPLCKMLDLWCNLMHERQAVLITTGYLDLQSAPGIWVHKWPGLAERS